MARKIKPYEQKAITTKICATSRVAVKIQDNYYTVESHEERDVPADADVDREWQFLWDHVNVITDNQVRDIVNTFTKK